jgi:hypothetical protein
MTRRHLLNAVIVVAVAVLAGGIASADISKNVIAAFRGQIVVTKGDLPEGKTDKETITKIKAAKVSSVQSVVNGDVKQWSFNYAAFLNKSGASSVKLEFWKDGKTYAADKNLTGVNPKSEMLTGEITIDEDENISPGASYQLKLVAGSTLLATTTLVMK